MSWQAASRLARVLLYEGYVLYPYRSSALKNRKRWAFGTLYPPSFCIEHEERSYCRGELLVRGEAARLRVLARFLHPIERSGGPGGAPWHEAKERDVEIGPIALSHLSSGRQRPFVVAGESWQAEGYRYERHENRGRLAVQAVALESGLCRLRVELHNDTELPLPVPSRDRAYLSALASAHLLLHCEDGEFVSAIDPPAALAPQVARCRSVGVFPTLVGSPDSCSTVLCSPIILSDHPQIAAESPGDLFDSTEIDELLSLRVLTLTEQERREAATTDPRVREILERVGQLDSDQLLAMHGARRGKQRRKPPFRLGERVRLRPAKGGDALDVVLKGEVATICAVEEDMEGRLYFAVTVDSDPALELGLATQPGHRFYFRAEELEVIS